MRSAKCFQRQTRQNIRMRDIKEEVQTYSGETVGVNELYQANKFINNLNSGHHEGVEYKIVDFGHTLVQNRLNEVRIPRMEKLLRIREENAALLENMQFGNTHTA